jgi:hypothetical protein
MSSLNDACDDYKIKNHKMEFDVSKIQSWELSEKYRHEPYLQYDVLSLREFFTFNDFMFDRDRVNITNYVTLSHMAYSLWSSDLDHLIEIPDMLKYEFIKKGTYGGRCYVQLAEYEGKYHNDVQCGNMTYEEL